MRRMRLLFALIVAAPLALVAAPLAVSAQPVPAPAGWTVSHSGANWVYTPTGRTFTLTIEPVQPLGGQDLDHWLAAHAQADASGRGTIIGSPSTQHSANGPLVTQLSYRDIQGTQWIALYTASLRDNGVQFSSIVTSLPASQAMAYVKTAGAIVGSATTAQPSTASAAGAAAGPALTSSPSGDGPIAAVMHEGRGESTVNGYQFIESADLLLKDGWAYIGLTVPPEYLDEAASKQREPTKWHRWKSSGNDVLIETGGQWSKLVADRARPLPSGAALNISLMHRKSFGFGGMGSVNSMQTIALSSSGHYERSSGTIAGTGAVQAGGGFSGGAGSFQNQNERRSSASGSNGTVTTTSSSRGAGDANLAGTYKVSGYTLELDGAGGVVQHVLAFYPFSDNKSIYIDGVTYNAQTHP